jgi:hypothetical protein
MDKVNVTSPIFEGLAKMGNSLTDSMAKTVKIINENFGGKYHEGNLPIKTWQKQYDKINK